MKEFITKIHGTTVAHTARPMGASPLNMAYMIIGR